jgi:hypothetical protein
MLRPRGGLSTLLYEFNSDGRMRIYDGYGSTFAIPGSSQFPSELYPAQRRLVLQRFGGRLSRSWWVAGGLMLDHEFLSLIAGVLITMSRKAGSDHVLQRICDLCDPKDDWFQMTIILTVLAMVGVQTAPERALRHIVNPNPKINQAARRRTIWS